MEKLTVIQKNIIDSIKHELSLKSEYYDPSSYRHSVWFHLKQGKFLFDDRWIKSEEIEPLIENNILVYNGIRLHQFENMARYILNKSI